MSRNRKQYTAEQKYKYHSQRRFTASTDHDSYYSEGWIDGFLGRSSKKQFDATCDFYNRYKKDLSPLVRAEFCGCINGMKASLKDPETAKRICLNVYSER